MPDNPAQVAVSLPAPLAVSDPTPLAPAITQPPKEIGLTEFINSLTVVDRNKRKFEVAVDARANRNQCKIVQAKIRDLFNLRLDEMLVSGNAPDMSSLQRMASVAKDLQLMSMATYEGNNPSGTGNNEFELFATSLVRAATEGAASGNGENLKERRSKMRALGKRNAKKVAAITEVETVEPNKAP